MHSCKFGHLPSLHFVTGHLRIVEMTGGGLGAPATATAWPSVPRRFFLGGSPVSLQRAASALSRHSSLVLFRSPDRKRENAVCDGVLWHLRHGSSSSTGARRAAAGGAAVEQDGNGGGGAFAFAVGFARGDSYSASARR